MNFGIGGFHFVERSWADGTPPDSSKGRPSCYIMEIMGTLFLVSTFTPDTYLIFISLDRVSFPSTFWSSKWSL